MKVCIVHIDDESAEPRQVSERIALDGLPHFFKRRIKKGEFNAQEGGYGNASITWQYDDAAFHIDYIKCSTAEEILRTNIQGYTEVVFVFDVHKDNEYGSGKLLTDSIINAKQQLAGNALKGIIWTNFPNSDVVQQSGLKYRMKKNVADFAIELMLMLGFTIHE
jgi:hypothetical protein